MTFDHNRLEDFFDKYVRGTITAEEFNEFWRLVKDGHANGTLSAKLTRLWQEWTDITELGAGAEPGAGTGMGSGSGWGMGSGPDKLKVFSRIMEQGKEREIKI